jgi:chaperonin GroEL
MLRGVDQLAETVKVTLGPRGLNVVLGVESGMPTITKDGVTVAKGIVLRDPLENLGAQMTREAALKTSDIAGDGTTTATILAQAIFGEGVKHVAAGANPMAIKRGIERAVAVVVEELNRISRPVSGLMIERVSTISANGDAGIGRMIGNATGKVGKDGVITVERYDGLDTMLEIAEGMQFDRGYINPNFVTDTVRMETAIEDPYILVYEKKISAMKDLLPLLEATAKRGSPLLIIAEDVDGEALATLLLNKSLHVCAVKAPGFGDQRKAMLQDIAILTGGHAITEELGTKLENVKLDNLGRARRVVIGEKSTTLIGGRGRPTEIQTRLRHIRGEIDKASSYRDRGQMQERLANMAGGVAIIKVGAPNETAMVEKKARVENAINAARAAIEEGVVPGGGVALLRCSSVLDSLKLAGDASIGVGIIRRTCQVPLRQIANNAGYSGSTIAGRILDSSEPDYGFNAATGEFEDLFVSGILDPAKVTRSALQNAASVSSLMLTAEAVIGDFPEGPSTGGRAVSYGKRYATGHTSRPFYDAPSQSTFAITLPPVKEEFASYQVSQVSAIGPGAIASSGDSSEPPGNGGEPPDEPPKDGAPPGGDGPLGPSEAPEIAVYPSIDPEPEHVVQNHPFHVTVSLQATPSEKTPGKVELPPGEHTLDVHLLLGDNSRWDTLVWSWKGGTIKKASFEFVAPVINARADSTVPERLYATLVANFYLNGRWCGEGLRNIEILLNDAVRASDYIEPPQAPLWCKLLNLEPGAEPPDLLVRIQQVAAGEYEWNLLSPHLDFRPRLGAIPERKPLGDEARRFVRTNFDRASGTVLEETAIPIIEARCRDIYESTAESFKDAYWKLHAAQKNVPLTTTEGKHPRDLSPQLKSIQFISDEPYVPWELMLVREDDSSRNPEHVREEILSIRHAVGRWTAKASGQLRQRIKVQELEVFASDYTRVKGVLPKLPWAIEERELLKGHYGAHPGTLKYKPVTQFLKNGKAQAIHFSCHGEMNVEQPADSALLLEDFPKFSTAYVAKEEVREGEGSQHPLVFLNACQLAGAGKQLSLVTGWPYTFLDAGASACIAPLWSVIDKNAGEVTTMFYRLVFDEHKTLGQALQQIRKEWLTSRNLTFLSYVLYGDPMAHVVWHRQPGSSPHASS